MKVILSRKGFDGSYGGYPSIILPKEMNEKMISFPIPETNEKSDGKLANDIVFKIADNTYKSLEDIFSELGIKDRIKMPNTKPNHRQIKYHYDPEIQEIKNQRKYGALGQSGAAAKHLIPNNLKKLKKDDIFLFFGTFKKTLLENNEIKYDTPMHEIQVIWGYLIVDDVINLSTQNQIPEKYSDLTNHLHFINHAYEKKDNIIICGKRFGTFNYSKELQLTKEGYSKSFWKLPEFLKGADISYCGKVENPDRFKSASIGQEFIISGFEEAQMKEWLVSLGVKF